jgi:hypothetical protein
VQKIRISKAAIGSSQIVLWGGAAIDPDCSPSGLDPGGA